MRLLLDTHLLLWAARGEPRMPSRALELINHPTNDLLFSAANIWEVVIKNSLGRDDFRVNPQVLRARLLENGYAELPILSKHALFVAGLPDLHRDPFDRILIAQALVEQVTLVTGDAALGRYSTSIVTV